MKSDGAKLSSPFRIRFTDRLLSLIEMRAKEKKMSRSALIRQICAQYFENEFSDATLVNLALAKQSRDIARLEDKIEMQGVIALESVRRQMARLPEKESLAPEMLEKAFEEFVLGCSQAFNGAHRGKLESMVLDFYERTGEADG